jgi:hypothetical protein
LAGMSYLLHSTRSLRLTSYRRHTIIAVMPIPRRALTLGVTLAIAAFQAVAQDASPKLTVLYSFSDYSVGPTAGLTVDSRSVLYGTTYNGGTNTSGAVFALLPPTSGGGSWTYKALHNFGSGNDGAFPHSGVVISEGGVLYGTTTYGGGTSCTFGCGTVYSLTPPASPGGRVDRDPDPHIHRRRRFLPVRHPGNRSQGRALRYL